MARYIDVDKFVSFIKNSNMEKQEKNTVLIAVQLQPTADVAEVVRCEDCKYYNRDRCKHERHETHSRAVYQYDDDFCSYGERRIRNDSTRNYKHFIKIS